MGGNRYISALLLKPSGLSGFGGVIFKRGRLCKKPPLESDSFRPFLAETRKGHISFPTKENGSPQPLQGFAMTVVVAAGPWDFWAGNCPQRGRYLTVGEGFQPSLPEIQDPPLRKGGDAQGISTIAVCLRGKEEPRQF